MKDYKIGFIDKFCSKKFRKYVKSSNINFIKNDIQNVNIEYNLDLNIIIVDDYEKEECDLVVYYLDYDLVNYDHFLDRSFFKNAKGNPKFLMWHHGEPHIYPNLDWNENEKILSDRHILRPLTEFIPFCSDYKIYSITSYIDTRHNCCLPYCISTYEICSLTDEDIVKQINNRKQQKKTKFCNMTFSHGTKERKLFYDIFNKYKKIDCYGAYNKNVGTCVFSNEVLQNIVLPKYKFTMCFENCRSDYDEMYVTEKLVNAFKNGTVPIYWGNNEQVYDIFNKNSFINLTGIPSNEWLDIIKKYDTNDALYNKMLNETPIKDKDSVDKYFRKTNEFIKNILTKKY